MLYIYRFLGKISMMKVSVVIPVFNQCQLTERCLRTLLEHSTLLESVFVIDNASRDQTPEVLNGFQVLFKQKGVPLNIFTNQENVGFGRACNQGIREFLKGEAQYLVVLNNDTWLMPQWDQALVQSLKKHHLDCVGPYFYEKPMTDNLTSIAAEFILRNAGKIRPHFVPILMCFTRSAIVRLSSDCAGSNGGIFDERYFVTYEDADLLKRMQLLGLKYGQSGDCFIWHHSKGTRSHTTLPSNYEQEGYRLFWEKWGFDPRPHQDSFLLKLRRKYWKFLEKYGRF